MEFKKKKKKKKQTNRKKKINTSTKSSNRMSNVNELNYKLQHNSTAFFLISHLHFLFGYCLLLPSIRKLNFMCMPEIHFIYAVDVETVLNVNERQLWSETRITGFHLFYFNFSFCIHVKHVVCAYRLRRRLVMPMRISLSFSSFFIAILLAKQTFVSVFPFYFLFSFCRRNVKRMRFSWTQCLIIFKTLFYLSIIHIMSTIFSFIFFCFKSFNRNTHIQLKYLIRPWNENNRNCL